jgi:hypothetical protein
LRDSIVQSMAIRELNSDPYLEAYLKEGPDKVWEMLEDYFLDIINWIQIYGRTKSTDR